jgi:hypothetical protein
VIVEVLVLNRLSIQPLLASHVSSWVVVVSFCLLWKIRTLPSLHFDRPLVLIFHVTFVVILDVALV